MLTLYDKHDLLKYMLVLQVSNFFLIFVYMLMLYARSAFIIEVAYRKCVHCLKLV
jgi:hypothetical protein